jgi:hypothetical protein
MMILAPQTFSALLCIPIFSILPEVLYLLRSTVSCPTIHHKGTWGERMYSSYSSSTSALAGSEWSAPHPGYALASGKDPQYPLYRRLGGPQNRCGQRLEEKSFHLCRGSNLNRPVIQPVARHYTDWATQLTTKYSILHNGILSWSFGSTKFYLSDEVFIIQLNPNIHIGHVRLFQLSCYHIPWLLYAPSTTLFCPSF